MRHDALPRLAWGAVLERGATVAVVHAGPWVEAREEFFAEGVWAGDFAAGDLAGASVCMATGGQVDGDTLIFSTPTHPYERLQWVRSGSRLIISNSLPFLLVLSGERLDAEYAGYRADLRSYRDGLDRYALTIPTARGARVHLAFHANVRVDRALRARREAKPGTPLFRDYASYTAMLRGALGALAANASAAGRSHPYTPLGTLSSGYDSPAVAVLAREIGCREVLTFGRAREYFGSASDSGRAIAAHLGLDVTELDRDDYRRLPECAEAEFLALGTGGEELVFAPAEPLLAGRMLLTGYLGDVAWARRSRVVNTTFRVGDQSGASFTEFRLRVGFAHVPVPPIGYLQHPALVAISNAPEMRPWSVGGDYDRPIARRLAEEAGVPRELFGQAKKAIVTYIDNRCPAGDLMTAEGYADFRAFVAGAPSLGVAAGRLHFRVLRLLYELRLRVHWRLDAAAKRLGLPQPRGPIALRRYAEDPGEGDAAFQWGVARLIGRYEGAMSAGEESTARRDAGALPGAQ